MGLSALFSWNLFFSGIKSTETYYLNLGTWIDLDVFKVDWAFSFNPLSKAMFVIVSTISFLVQLYSLEYMKNDPKITQFLAYLSWFTFYMYCLIFGDNFLILFLGWEGVGLCSYLLISFWSERVQANKAAMKAMIVNRVSDYALTMGFAAIYKVFNTLDFDTFFSLLPYFSDTTFTFYKTFTVNAYTMMATLLFLGAMGKSAQILLHTWLPDAMEGPTPVSALIHAATMVTAGIYLVIKCSPLFEYTPKVLIMITCCGALTICFAGIVGAFQYDIKKVIAYSTCSQLGYMILACGASQYHLSFFHLATHAFFKALLFLSAGALIHSYLGEQDLRKFGAADTLVPFTAAMFTIGNAALIGTPFLSGFFSKDLIIEVFYVKYTVLSLPLLSLTLIGVLFTSIYTTQSIVYLYANRFYTCTKTTAAHIHETPILMAVPLMCLALGSIFYGYYFKELFVGFGTNYWQNSIYIDPNNNIQFDAEFIPFFIKILPAVITCIAGGIFDEFVLISPKLARDFTLFQSGKWHFDTVYNNLCNYPFLEACYINVVQIIDKGFAELLTPVFFKEFLNVYCGWFTNMQTLYSYRVLNLIALLIFMYAI